MEKEEYLNAPTHPYGPSSKSWEAGRAPSMARAVKGSFLLQVLFLAKFWKASIHYLETLNLGITDIWAGYFFVVGLSCALQDA